MPAKAYYNENDPFNAEWLRRLIRNGLLTSGEVDDRSISEVRSGDLRGFSRVHFFAGIGVWDHALSVAGWEDDDRPIWTGSCPCQPWARVGYVHGQNKGFDDARHLWPEWFRLIRECRPDEILGEQVPDGINTGWYDAVATDLEGEGYACGSLVFKASAVGEPIRRERLYFAAEHLSQGVQRQRQGGDPCEARPQRWGGQADLRALTQSPFLARGSWPKPIIRRVDYGRADAVAPLRAFGNALNVEAAVAFIKAVKGLKS